MAKRKTGDQSSMIDTGVQAMGRTIGKVTQATEDLLASGAGLVGLGPKKRDRVDETARKASAAGGRASRKRAGGASRRAAGRKVVSKRAAAGAGAKRAGGRAKTAARKSAGRKSAGRKTAGRAKK